MVKIEILTLFILPRREVFVPLLYICSETLLYNKGMDTIEDYGIEIDSEVVNQDVDDVDLYAEREVEDTDDCGIQFE